jgi:predicted HTH transcriptional regulator
MIPRPLSAIGPEDIRSLIENEVRESRTIDYKQALYATADKLSLLKDVSALANTDGGDIVCGIAERLEGGKTTGVPEKVIGLAGFNEDQETRRLDDTLRNGLSPRLLGVHYKTVDCPEGPVLVIRVERSFNGPHRVEKDEQRFYGRAAMGNYVLNTDELRRLFLKSTDLPERIRRFRNERIEAGATKKDTVPAIPRKPRFYMLLVPLRAFEMGGKH